jgi:4-hydroxybenzoate polyprenyltransferase
VEHERNTPGPSGPATRRIVAWILILALVLGLPLSYLIGMAQMPGGAEILIALLVVGLLVGGVTVWLHRRTRD